MRELPPAVIETLQQFLEEDIRSGDLTTEVTVPKDKLGVGTIFARSKAILAGIEEIVAIAELTDLEFEILAKEGEWVLPDNPVLRLKGAASTLLTVERVCLNIIMRMSGIATKTREMVEIAKSENEKVSVAATRKTTPGFRYFEKRAVRVGGGDPHRYALDDMVLIKNNHIAVVGGVSPAVRAARNQVSFSTKVSCEARSLEETIEAIESGADIVLLDNLKPDEIKKVHETLAEKGLRQKVILEVSGGIDKDNLAAYAKTGVDVISSGSLTHSYDSSDFNMQISLL